MNEHPEAITPATFPWFDYSKYSFSLGLEYKGTCYLSGHSASEYDDSSGKMVIRGGMEDQIHTAFSKIEHILAAANLGIDDIFHIVEYVTNKGIKYYDDVIATRSTILGSQMPAVSTILVDELLRPDALIEIEVTAGRCNPSDSLTPKHQIGTSTARGSDDSVFLSTIYPYDNDGNLVGLDDPVAQVTQIFVNAQEKLQSVGLSMSDVARTIEMLRPEALAMYKETGRIRREFLGPIYPAAAGILQSQVAPDPNVLIAYDFVASRHQLEAINPGWSRYDKLTYSPGVRAGNILFLSGQAALDPETQKAVHTGDIVAQTEYTYRNHLRVVEEAGMQPSDVVQTVEFITKRGLPNYRGTAEIRKKLFSTPYPASTGVICHKLLRPEFDIEIIPLAIDSSEDN